jgi:Putative metallopeptidase domain
MKSVARGKPDWRHVNLSDLKALLATVTADPAVVEQARRKKESALLDFGVGHSVVASWLYAKCHHHIPTTAIPTAAVMATGDGSCALLFNPYFFAELDLDGVKFVLFHEARHLMHRHLYVDEVLRSDPVFVLAAEVSINHVALARLHRVGMPVRVIRDEEGNDVGEPVGVDPGEVYRDYTRDLRRQGLKALEFDDFVETDLSVYRELKRMSVAQSREIVVCLHLQPDTGEGDRELGLAGVPMDAETIDRVCSEVLQEVMRAALRGNAAARAELLDLADRSAGGGDRCERMWGSLGLDKLRGVTPRTRRVDWWKRWLTDVLASKLSDGERLVYPKKLGAVLLALGHDPFLHRRGRERTKVVLVAFDTSGSMPDSVVEWLTTLVGQTDGVESHWLSFDGAVAPFVPGERVVGGGGTNFQNVVDYAEGRLEVNGRRFEEIPDAIIVVTDGYAPAVTPAQPDRWIWLITDGGDEWPERHHPPMACHRVTAGR